MRQRSGVPREKRSRITVTPVGVIGLGLAGIGLALFVFADRTVAGVGGIAAVVGIAFLLSPPAGLTGGFLTGGGRGRDFSSTPAPEYIDHAATPSEAVWRDEEERYREENGSKPGTP